MSTDGFDGGLDRFIGKLERMSVELLPAVAARVHESITVGSPLTGAPGQPVDTGALRASWQLTFPTPESAEISTKSVYALPNEDGVTEDGRPYVQRSPVGGRHSLALTAMNLQKIVDHEAAAIAGEGR